MKKWSQIFHFPSLKNSSWGQFLCGLQIVNMSLNFKTFCCSLKITGLGKNRQVFLYYVSFSRYFILNRIVPRFYVKRRYWISLLIEKESLNFLLRFHSHLLLLQGYTYPSLKNIITESGARRSPSWTKFLKDFFGETS